MRKVIDHDPVTGISHVLYHDESEGVSRYVAEQDTSFLLDFNRKQANEAGKKIPLEALRYQRQLLENLRLLESINQELASAQVDLAALINAPLGQPIAIAAGDLRNIGAAVRAVGRDVKRGGDGFRVFGERIEAALVDQAELDEVQPELGVDDLIEHRASALRLERGDGGRVTVQHAQIEALGQVSRQRPAHRPGEHEQRDDHDRRRVELSPRPEPVVHLPHPC